jgi:hypothetical protein
MRVLVLCGEHTTHGVGTDGDARVAELRARGIAAVAFAGSAEAVRAYARAWGFTHLMRGPDLVDLSC